MIDFLRKHIIGAGEICRHGQQTLTAAEIDFKGPKDLVTHVDRQVERYLVERIGDRKSVV